MVSVIVPCYNQSDYLDKCLNSVLNQSYKDWECLIINDGSIDNTSKIAKKWINHDIRFKYFEKINGGLSSARNLGLDYAKGEFVFFLDSDDLISVDCLKVLYNELTFHNVDLAIGKTGYCKGQIYEYYESENFDFKCNVKLENDNLSNLFFLSENNVLPIGPNKLYNINFLKENNIYFKSNLLHEDELFFFNVIYCSNSIVIIDNVTYFYNKGNNNSITKNLSYKNVLSNIYILESFFEFYKNETNKIRKNTLAVYILFFKKTVLYFYETLNLQDKRLCEEKLNNCFKRTRLKITSRKIFNSKLTYWRKLNKIYFLSIEEINKYFELKKNRNKLYKFYDLKVNFLYLFFKKF